MSKSRKSAVEAVAQVETPVETEAATATATETETETKVEVENIESAVKLIAKYGSKSNAIRAMSAEGMKTGPIAKALNIRYQHVRNVLMRPLKRVIKEERDAKAQAQATATSNDSDNDNDSDDTNK